MIGATISITGAEPCGTMVRCVMSNRPPNAKNPRPAPGKKARNPESRRETETAAA
jgi:hypothetical protein